MNLLLRILLPLLIAVVYIGVAWYSFYAIKHHPWVLISIIVIGGFPIGYVAYRFSEKGAQQRSLWSTTQSYVKSDVSVVPEPDQAAKVFGAGMIDSIRFRHLSFFAGDGGVRIERTFGAFGPIVIGWGPIQRLDLLRFPQKGKIPAHNGAVISLKSVNREIVLIPWPDHFHALVPDRIGQRTHLVTE